MGVSHQNGYIAALPLPAFFCDNCPCGGLTEVTGGSLIYYFSNLIFQGVLLRFFRFPFTGGKTEERPTQAEDGIVGDPVAVSDGGFEESG
jgi:hypothetical protein